MSATNAGVAVITGASCGIGAATARALIAEGYQDVARGSPAEVAELTAFILARPRHLVINEVLQRPADQLG
ncbi:hypothetical protein GCM10022223_32250 [Kineosporia mesophila]|uniref:SDR family NAD(P)-dependent oxidoreductase n=1 Tax=Kineosporia mesophila TaxID=566012 RepID=A0ABP6ZSA1_9ACTN|nr:SDR family NAD(P)-dependent oxidoreductase [Kineosporia mesophila]MCD5354449.1 SDR family NAD(P)-dependent oxidoreductase [Kineosporia mesophila]